VHGYVHGEHANRVAEANEREFSEERIAPEELRGDENDGPHYGHADHIPD